MLVQVTNKKNNMSGEIHQTVRVITREKLNNIFTVTLKVWLLWIASRYRVGYIPTASKSRSNMLDNTGH